jgi:hypothetical protein
MQRNAVNSEMISMNGQNALLRSISVAKHKAVELEQGYQFSVITAGLLYMLIYPDPKSDLL